MSAGIMILVRAMDAVRIDNRLLDALARRTGLWAIAAYRLGPRRLARRQCLFRPSCSRRATGFLAEHRWNDAITLTRAQLTRCCSDFAMSADASGRCHLVTCDGMHFDDHEIAPGLLAWRQRGP